MTERDLHHLLTEAAGDPPRPLDPDDVLRTAGRRRTARAGVLVGGLAVAGVAVALLIPTLTPRTPQVAVPAATPTASAPGTASTPAGTPTPAPVVCPTASPPDTSIRDWAHVVVWDGHDYSGVFTDDPIEVGEPVGVVHCNIQVISNDGHSDVSRPWPDGTATFLPVGTPLLTVVGQDPACYLAARFDGHLSVFRAWENSPTPTPRKGCEPKPSSSLEPVNPAPQPSGTTGPPKTQPVEPKR